MICFWIPRVQFWAMNMWLSVVLLGTAWGTHENSNLIAAARIVNCGYSWHKSMGNGFFHSFRASPLVLSMWFQIVKFIAKKPKCAGLAQEIGFSTPNSRSLPWKNVINWTWLRSRWFPISSPKVYAVLVKVYWWGCQKTKQLNLNI
jgi:hypothetical protein